MTTNPNAKSPTFTSATVNRPGDPLVLGSCFTSFCPTSIYDFIDLRFDRRGSPWAAFVDACIAECAKGQEENARLGVVGRLIDASAKRRRRR